MSRIYHGGRQMVYTATVGAMLAQNMAMPAYANLTVNAGQTSTGLTVGVDPSNSVVTKLSNYGTTINTVVNSGGGEIIYSGGITSNTTVNSHGWQDASSGGIAINTIVNNDGFGQQCSRFV